ncbi:MAG: hypothetical protein LBU87_01540 [Lactobacillales bacterium]|jgi:hypothetical protein|nr:hypothetical protein [Lactobacillales bacterium]
MTDKTIFDKMDEITELYDHDIYARADGSAPMSRCEKRYRILKHRNRFYVYNRDNGQENPHFKSLNITSKDGSTTACLYNRREKVEINLAQSILIDIHMTDVRIFPGGVSYFSEDGFQFRPWNIHDHDIEDAVARKIFTHFHAYKTNTHWIILHESGRMIAAHKKENEFKEILDYMMVKSKTGHWEYYNEAGSKRPMGSPRTPPGTLLYKARG